MFQKLDAKIDEMAAADKVELKPLSKNQIYKKYGLTYTRQKKLIINGLITQTPDGLILESSVIDYLHNDNKS